VGSRTWRADDGTAAEGSPFGVSVNRFGAGAEIAVAVSISQSVETQARAYIAANLPTVGTVASFVLPTGPGQRTVAGGEHAAVLAEAVSNAVREIKAGAPDTRVHIFAACPNSFLFFLGQVHQAIAPCIVYEFDFDRRGNKTYQPSFLIG
jgi:hypothetical protein